MTEQIVSSFNLFVDTDRGEASGASAGDNFNLHLNTVGVQADKGQQLRLTLNNFNMYKTFPNVNANNSKVRVITYPPSLFAPGAALPPSIDNIDLTHQNYGTVADIAADFAEKLRGVIESQIRVKTVQPNLNVTLITVGPTAGAVAATTNNIISMTFTTSISHTLTAGHLVIQCQESDGDSYALLGGDRITYPTDETTSSFDVTFPTATTIQVNCRYPALRSTSQYVYLRTDLISNTLETSSLTAATLAGNHISDVHHSNILARVPIDTEFIHFDAKTGREYFLDVKQKHLQTVRFYLTDEHNRPLPKISAAHSVSGNFSFSMVVRVDVIQTRAPNERFTPDPVRTVPARFSAPMIEP